MKNQLVLHSFVDPPGDAAGRGRRRRHHVEPDRRTPDAGEPDGRAEAARRALHDATRRAAAREQARRAARERALIDAMEHPRLPRVGVPPRRRSGHDAAA